LGIIANKSVRKCRNRLKSREVDECKLGIFETGGLYGLPVTKLEAETAWWTVRSLTLKGSLTLLLAATPENQHLWVHRGEVFCSLEAQSDIGSNDNDGLACKIDMFHRGYLPPLILNEFEKPNSSHDIERSVKGNFTKCLWLSDIRQSVSSYTCLGVYSYGTGQSRELRR
jgi:hypothetical protein